MNLKVSAKKGNTMNMQSIVIEQMAAEHREELYESSIASRPINQIAGAPAAQSLVARFAGWFKAVTAPVNRPAVVADR